MFSGNWKDFPQSTNLSASKSKSYLSSFLFPQSPQQGQKEQGSNHSKSQSKVPLTLHSNLLPPSLLEDGLGALRSRTVTDDMDESRSSFLLHPPPHNTWSIASSDDHKVLPKIPCHYPPLDPNCSALVTDAPPSIVVVRISECLRRRSIAAEYDDETVSARCMTVDRVHFQIQLYRTPSSSPVDCDDDTMLPPGAIIVEIRKISGGIMSFYAACSKILLAAQGLDTGDDERQSHQRNGMEFPPCLTGKRRHPSSMVSSSRMLKRRRLPTLNDTCPTRSSDRVSIAEQSLEDALVLLQKDRLECQQLGMERLVNLTNRDSVGKDISRFVSRRLLQHKNSESTNDVLTSSTNRWKLIVCLMHPGAEQALLKAPEIDRSLEFVPDSPNGKDTKNDRMVRSFLESPALTSVTPLSRMHSQDEHQPLSSSPKKGAAFLKKKRSPRKSLLTENESMCQSNDEMSPDELRHEARLRSLAMRVFCNALENLSRTKELHSILHCSPNTMASQWVKPAFLLSLVQDLQGAGRPFSVSETGYKLASVHEAAMTARCLRLLAGYDGDESEDDGEDSHPHVLSSNDGEDQEAVRDFLRSEAVLERLEYARSCGRVHHAVLHYEAERTYNKLTENDRSC